MVAFRAANTGSEMFASSVTVTKPSGTAEDDILVAFLVARSGTWNNPAGWTVQGTVTNSDTQIKILTKVAGGSEPASYSFTVTADAEIAAAVLAYSGGDTSTPVDVEASASSLTSPTVTTTKDDTIVIRLCGCSLSGGDISSPSGNTQRAEVEGMDLGMNVADKDQASAGAAGTAAFTGSGPPIEPASYTLAINNAPASGPAAGVPRLLLGVG